MWVCACACLCTKSTLWHTAVALGLWLQWSRVNRAAGNIYGERFPPLTGNLRCFTFISRGGILAQIYWKIAWGKSFCASLCLWGGTIPGKQEWRDKKMWGREGGREKYKGMCYTADHSSDHQAQVTSSSHGMSSKRPYEEASQNCSPPLALLGCVPGHARKQLEQPVWGSVVATFGMVVTVASWAISEALWWGTDGQDTCRRPKAWAA